MPTINDIEKFKAYLAALGHEPSILAEKGEKVVDLPLPEEGLSEDLAELLGSFSLPEEEPVSETEETEEVAPPEDFDSLPDDWLDLGKEEPLSETPIDAISETAEEISARSPFDVDLGDLEPPEEFRLPQEEPEQEKEEFEDLDFGQTESAGEEEFSIPDFSEPVESFGTEELPAEFSEEAEEFPAEEVFEPGGEEEGETEEFSLDDFSMPEGSPFEKEEPLAREGAEAEEFSAEEVFEPGEEGEEEIEEFSLDDFSMPEGIAFEKEEPSAQEGKEAESFQLPEEGFGTEIPESVEEFDLGDFSDQFGLLLDVKEDRDVSVKEVFGGESVTEELTEEETDLSISQEDFKKIQATLAKYPRNLRIIIEELIGEKQLSGSDLENLLQILIRGGSPRDCALIVGRITGKKIKIPPQYEKKTGLEFEEEKTTFAYLFKKNILPVLRVVVLSLAAAGILFFLGQRFIYRPLRAISLYKKGYQEVTQDNYERGNEFFREATDFRSIKKWYFSYAEAFTDKRQYFLAQEKYDELLKNYPGDERGILDYAALESVVLKNYEKAERLLSPLIDKDPKHYKGLLLLGDTYLEWASEDSSKYERARYSYATLIDKYGEKPELLFRMLRYFIRTDNEKEVLALKDYFQASPKIKVDPLSYSDLAGYLLDKGIINDVREILLRASAQNTQFPEIHYQLGRFFNITRDSWEEELALTTAINLFQEKSPLTSLQMGLLIDSYNRLGLNYYLKKKYLDAEEQYNQGIALYRESLQRRFIGRAPKYGNLFANLADLNYYISGDLNTALALYREARQNLFDPPQVSYKIGFILYRRRDYDSALLEFYRAAQGYSNNRNLLFATANTLYLRNSHFSAQGYYNQVLDILEKELSSTPHLLLDERPDHYALIENLMKTYNNLGVTIYSLYRRSEDPDKFGDALLYLTKASEYYDWLTRNPDTLERSESMNLGFLNSRALLYPLAGHAPRIFQELPRDLEDLFFR